MINKLIGIGLSEFLVFGVSLLINGNNCIEGGIDYGYPIRFYMRCNEGDGTAGRPDFILGPLLLDICTVLIFIGIFLNLKKLATHGFSQLQTSEKLWFGINVFGMLFGGVMLYLAMQHPTHGKDVIYHEEMPISEILRVPIIWWTIATLVVSAAGFSIRYLFKRIRLSKQTISREIRRPHDVGE